MSQGSRSALRLLDQAFDAGIRHFDTAPLYGAGDAESAVGIFLRGRRSEVTVTTKFGLEPPGRHGALRAAIPVGRRLARAFPATRAVLTRAMPAPSLAPDRFSRAAATASLERSLRALRTDYVDYFLLHGYSPMDALTSDLLLFLEECAQRGVIKAAGVGTSLPETSMLSQALPPTLRVWQFESSVLLPRSVLFGAESERVLITHGSLGSSYHALLRWLREHPAQAFDWSRALGLDIAADANLSALMLDYALRRNGSKLVLFSSKSPARILANAAIMQESPVDAQISELFGRLVSGVRDQVADGVEG